MALAKPACYAPLQALFHLCRAKYCASRFAPHQPDSPLRLSYYGIADGLAELMTGRDALLQYVKFRRGGRTDPANPEIDSPEIDKFSCAPFLDTEIRHLSGGQRQRLALSRLALDLATTEERYLWLLDEPDSALDIEGRQVLEEMISDMLASGGRVIMTSHQPPISSLPTGCWN